MFVIREPKRRWPIFAVVSVFLLALSGAWGEGASEAGLDAPLPRICVREGRFVEKVSGRPFVPRGFNYIRLIPVNHPKGPRPTHGTFAPSHYDAKKVEAMFADLRQNGFNVVRVFIHHGYKEGIAGSKDSLELSPAYLANFIDFLKRGRRHGVYVIPALGWLPQSKGYLDLIGEKPKDIQGKNLYYLHRGFINAKAKYMADFARAIQKHDPDLLTTIFAYELENETHLVATQAPFSLTEGTCTPADGKTYDLTSAQELQKMADENVNLWADACVDAVHAVDPEVMVSTNVFTFRAVHRTGPGKLRTDQSEDERFPARPLALTRTKLDYLDIHFYPMDDKTLDRDLKSIEFDEFKKACDEKGIPLIMGEYGAFNFAYKTLDEAVVAMEKHLTRVRDLGFVGDIYWTYDCDEQDRLWNAKSGEGQIFKMLASMNRPAKADWRELVTVEDVCRMYPERMRALLESIDLNRPALAAVKQAVDKGDVPAACTALLAYYREGSSGKWLRRDPVPSSDKKDETAEAILKDTFTFYTQSSRVPRRPDGRLDWDYRGPTNDFEWALALNRHHHIDSLQSAYERTGNMAYVRRLDEDLRDWVISSLPYPASKNATAMWRGLETSFRVKKWAAAFYGLQDVEAFRPATRLLLMSSLPEHAHYLRHFHSGGNWMTMELSALATAGAAWPEFKDATSWLTYALETLQRDLDIQVYPDGVQKELTSSYHWVALSNFEQCAEVCRQAGVAVPPHYASRLEDMWNYLAYSIRPDGYGLLNNDSDRNFNRDKILDAADKYRRPDWAYIASNGRAGQAPARPSVMFTWVGHLLMRSGFDADAQWGFFDLGPWGTGHQHNDMLHLSITAGGRDLLVDSGRFSYSGEIAAKFRVPYAFHSAGHNVILMDGQGQSPGPLSATSALPNTAYRLEKDFDYARGVCPHFAKVEGKISHARSVLYVRGHCWLVVDQIDTDRPRKLEALWHWHPACTVKASGLRVESTDEGKGNLAVMPIGDVKWSVELVKGQTEPRLQGWYSEKYNKYEPATAAVYSLSVDRSTTFGWILYPAKGSVPPYSASVRACDAERMTVQVDLPQGESLTLVVPLTEGGQPAVNHGSKQASK